MEIHVEILKLTVFIIVSHLVIKKVKAFVSGWLGILPRANKNPRETPEQLELKAIADEIQTMKQEAETYNEPASFAKYAKM